MRIVVYGRPAPQGSKRFLGRVGANAKGIMVENSPHAPAWRNDVTAACIRLLNEQGMPEPMDGPLVARMVFTVAKPVSAPKRKTTFPATMPDLSKLIRNTEDALTAAGVIKDDARIVEYSRAAKVYPGEDVEALDRPGAIIVIKYHPGLEADTELHSTKKGRGTPPRLRSVA